MDRPARRPRRPPWVPLAVVGLVVVATGLRVVHLDWACLTRDESFSWRLVQYDWRELVDRTAADVHPPLYYLLLKGWAGAWGASIRSLRGFSVLWGVASTALMYVTVREALRLGGGASARGMGLERLAGLVGAALITFHADQITASRTARMYSLGVFLALASSWLMLRALRSRRRHLWWWPAYGASAALCCLTHYFAAFAVIAQGLFIFVEIARSWYVGRRRRARSVMAGCVTAVALCLVLYAPWIPAMVSQVGSVREGFWIPPLSGQAINEALFGWTTGFAGPATVLETWLVRALLAAALIAAVWRFDPAGLLFAFQAAVPWLLCLGLSAASGQSILQERYLIFAQTGLFGMLAVVLGRGGWLPFRAAVLWMACSMTLHGTVERVSEFPVEPPGVVQAITFVAQHARAGDTVMASSHRTLNRLRYYASEAGFDPSRIRCMMSPRTTRGHIVHVASLEDGDIIWRRVGDRVDFERAWFVFADDEEIPWVPDGMRIAHERRFPGREGSTWAAVLYVRERG